MSKFLNLLRRFHNDERGAFLALFGVIAIVLIATAGATVDFTSVQNARTRAQVALDASALALQPMIYDPTWTTEQVRAAAEALLLNRLADASITGKVTSAVPDKTAGTLQLTATLKAPLIFVALVGVKEMNMTLVSQATRGSQDLEVAVALDVTGSMLQNDKIGALRVAAADMVDILVEDIQEPTYTKMALIPYSMGVNVGSYANAVRGTPIGGKAVTNVAWANGAAKTGVNVSKDNPAVVTTPADHNMQTGDAVWISGITGSNTTWQGLNNKAYTITVTSAKKFQLNGLDTSGYSGSSTGGQVTECLTTGCELVVTSAGHPFANGDLAFFTAIGGTTQLNSSADDIDDEDPKFFTASAVTTNTFNLQGTVGPNYTTYSSGGSAWCSKYGCQYYRFQNPWGFWRLYNISTCVTERTISPNQYTDVAPTTTLVGANYVKDTDNCLSAQIVPLTSDKTLLKGVIAGLDAEGSTAGQIGTAWAWYMLSPQFAYLWPTASKPAAYNKKNVMKVLVLMTDGSFNSVYCNGVISADSISGSGSAFDHIGCDATNGDPFGQTKSLCDSIKANNGITVYTVGFDISDQSDEKDMLSYCATDAGKFKLADDAEALKQVFQEIAQDIAQLRLSL